MEKQHNRGQDGAGIATVKLNVESGYQFMHRIRSNASQPIADIFKTIHKEVGDLEKMYPDIKNYPGLLKGYLPFMGEVMLGHLRYGTQGKNNIEFCHPFILPHINPNRHLALAGNFNLVNTEELFDLVDAKPGDLHKNSDLAAMIESIHHHLQKEDEKNPENLDVPELLRQATKRFDGGFHIGGLIGTGDSFVMRDAHGIRPSYYYVDDEVVVAASERPAIMTCFNIALEDIKELDPGSALVTKADGSYEIHQILEPKTKNACSFERIYFSRGSDAEIYQERQELGRLLADRVLKTIDYDLRNTIFSFIPNTAEIAFYGLIKGLESYLNEIKIQRIQSWGKDFDEEKLTEMITRRVRIDKIAIKDVKMRTFITEDASRNELVQHVYDITYGTVRPGIDSLVVIDDSIVRGTTLRESIIKMLDRLGPKKIIIISSAPQIRYPDCYGIDMSKMGEFIAFQAAVQLLKDNGQEQVLHDVYNECKQAEANGKLHEVNYVQGVYKQFTADQISNKSAVMLKPEGVNAEVEIIYQSIEDLHQACPKNLGDWYFTGNYPTPGGNRVVNKAFMNYMEGKNERGY